jgi:non-heme chloroperoxidase
MKNKNTGYTITPDGESLYHCTNFPVDSLTANDTVLVFNYGLVCSNEHWREQLPHFDQLGYKILIHDLRGHHNSTGPTDHSTWNFDIVANDLNEILKHLNITNTIMLGHSMGVNITLEFAKQFPEKVSGMVLISGTVIPPQGVMFNSNAFEYITPAAQAVLEKYPEQFQVFWDTGGLNPIFQKLVHWGGFNTDKTPIDFVQKYLNRIATLPPEIFFQSFQQMAEHDIINYLERIQTPALVMGGDQDKVVPNHLQEFLSNALPNAQKYVISEGSHVPQVDFPETVNERIHLFLNKIKNNSKSALPTA